MHVQVEALLPHGYSDPAAALHAVEGLVPLSTLQAIADTHAHRTWGDDIARGEALPVADPTGAVSAYVFPYIRGSRRFPGYEQIFAEIERLANSNQPSPFGDIEAQFGAVHVSATRRGFPILRVDHYLHPYFVNGLRAEQIASERFGQPSVRFQKLIAADALEEYFEFTFENRRILLHSHSLEDAPAERFTAWRARGGAAADNAREADACWEAIECASLLRIAAEPARGASNTKYLASLARVPALLWTLNCATTSKAMVLGFWDHYAPAAGASTGFGRLIDYWYEHASNGQNVPNLIDEVHAANNIDVWAVNNYSCQWDEIPAGPNNDWAWQDYVAEINADRPACWSIAGHTMAGIGYHSEPWGKWAIVYNTWSTKPAEFVHSECAGVARIIPKGGNTGQQLALMSPRDGETMYSSTPCEICWHVWGLDIGKTDLAVSEDGGANWSMLAKSVETKPGLNFYIWTPGKATAKARIRASGYSDAEYIAGDGSFRNFSVEAQVTAAGWRKIRGPVGTVVAGYDKVKGLPVIFATDYPDGDVYALEGPLSDGASWLKIGGPGKMFVMDGQGRLYGLSPDSSSVYLYSGAPGNWKAIGGPAAAIFADENGVCATSPDTGDLHRYAGNPFTWIHVGGPGKTFGADCLGALYGVSPDESGVWQYIGTPMKWTRIAGPASALLARGHGVYAIKPESGNIYLYHGKPFCWTKIGGPGKSFAVDVEGRLFGLSPDSSGVFRYDGSYQDPMRWTRIGGAAAGIAAGWRVLLATNPQTRDLWAFTK
jgi:hypothetical protein